MPRDAEPGWRRRTEAVPSDNSAPGLVDETIETQLADLVAYCRTLTGRETDAVSTAHSVMDTAHSLLSDPELLRAWLFALARRKALATRPRGSAQADSPQPRELLDLVHRHGIRPDDLPVVLGMPAVETAALLAAAEAESDSRAASGPDDDSDRFSNSGWHDGTSGDDWAKPSSRAEPNSRAERDGTAERDDWPRRDDRAEKDHGRPLDDFEGPMRTPPDSAGRHAARSVRSGGWRALTSGRARLAAATAIVVAIIGVGAAYLAESVHGAGSPGPAGLESSHHPRPAPRSPATTPSPTPTAFPTHSLAPTKSVTVVQPPPAPTTSKPKPSPTQSTTSPAPTTPPPTTPPPTTPPVSTSS